jgi:subtilisin family serine protease
MDRFCWEHKDFLIVVAAGNEGSSWGTVGSPATGKNVIGVGATVHGDQDPPCVVGFSSRGWTRDGRIKPDVVAPGTSVVSARSDRNIYTGNCTVTPISGTSMACPTVAGLAALVRQYYRQGYYPEGTAGSSPGLSPSAALVKATLIASAVDLTTVGCGAFETIPAHEQGWGLVQLDRALYFPGDDSRLVVDDHRIGFAGSRDPVVHTRFEMKRAGPLKVVLVWTDAPSTSLADVNLVNDLDLAVTGPDGSFLGNVMDAGASHTGGDPDRLNNVEVVYLPQALPGTWTVAVRPHVVNIGPQDYAVVITGPVSTDPPRQAQGRLGR